MTSLPLTTARDCQGNYSEAHSVVIPSRHARPAKRCAAFFSEDDTRNRLRSGVYGTYSAEKACGKKASRSAGIACRDGISSIPQEHDLRSPEQLERFRMLDYISLLQNANNAGRAAHELTTGEVNQLKGLSDGQYDRAANWISNLLCLYYQHCRPPRTGGEVGGAKSQRIRSTSSADRMVDAITIAPNPTQAWATVTYSLTKEATDGLIEVKDATGRPVLSERLAGKQGQVVLDTRLLAKGAYTVQCRADGVVLITERLIVQ